MLYRLGPYPIERLGLYKKSEPCSARMDIATRFSLSSKRMCVPFRAINAPL